MANDTQEKHTYTGYVQNVIRIDKDRGGKPWLKITLDDGREISCFAAGGYELLFPPVIAAHKEGGQLTMEITESGSNPKNEGKPYLNLTGIEGVVLPERAPRGGGNGNGGGKPAPAALTTDVSTHRGLALQAAATIWHSEVLRNKGEMDLARFRLLLQRCESYVMGGRFFNLGNLNHTEG